MTLTTQTSSFITEIPYREDSAYYVESILHLPGCIFFDSGYPINTERGRYDIFSANPLYTLSYSQGTLSHSGGSIEKLDGNQLTTRLNELLKKHSSQLPPPYIEEKLSGLQLPFYGGFAGYFSYDLARCWERLPENAICDIDIPELMFGFYPWAGIVDHQDKKAWISVLPECPIGLKEQITSLLSSTKLDKITNKKFKLIIKLESLFNVKHYSESIAKIQQYILNGDCYQVNFAQRFSGRYQGHPWAAYKKLRLSMAAPFGTYYQFNSNAALSMEIGEDSAILSYSPERFVEVREKSVLTQPIKGTIKRHTDPIQDKANAEKLSASEKNRAENLMIVDLLRNDLGKCCEYGTIKTEKLFELQSVSNVHHLVSTVSGKLRDDMTSFDLLQAILPGGSITGAPKIRSMEIIEELEPFRRAIYCGVMAYININGDMDSNIAIRTVLCNDGAIHCWGGGGIVADSEAQQEYDESLIKIQSLLKGLESLI